MILKEFALLASDTARTKAYLQAMIKENLLPGFCVVYSDDVEKMQADAEQYNEVVEQHEYFDLDIPVLYSLKKSAIDYIAINTKDINSEEMLNCLMKLEQKFLIYSGYGGYILKRPLFEMGKDIIHVHAGLLPQYRGSTTAYYSYLQDKIFGATAIFMNEGLDEGKIIGQDVFFAPQNEVNIDYIYEPFIRSKVLIQILKKYMVSGNLNGSIQSVDDARTYFIIHPVLKHLALLEMEGRRNK